MFLPEYSITNNIVNALGKVEYAKAVVENMPILKNIESQIKKLAQTKILQSSLESLGERISYEDAKKYVDSLFTNPSEQMRNTGQTLSMVYALEENFSAATLKKLSGALLGTEIVNFRTQNEKPYTSSEEVLASVVELMDWCQSIDALETHAVLAAGVVRAQLEKIRPFEAGNDVISNFFTHMVLRWRGYGLKDYLAFEDKFRKDQQEFDKARVSIFRDEPDLTTWLEYFTQTLSRDAMDITERVKTSAKETKVAKTQGTAHLSPRQLRILEHIEDYGNFTNRDFTLIFPDISEDSVLRDLRVLTEKNLIYKEGVTKSSRYKLRS